MNQVPDIVVDDNTEELADSAKKQKKSRKSKRDAEATQDESGIEAEAEDAGGKKKKRKEKAEKPEKQKDKEGAGSNLLFKILVIAIPILLVGGFVFEEIYWNMLGVRDWTCDALISAVSWLDPSTASVRRTQWLRGKELDEREAEIAARDEEQKSESAARKAELDEREDSLMIREEEVEIYSSSLDKREQEMVSMEVSKTPVYRRELEEEELAEMEALSATFAAMTPDAAAEILMRMYNVGDVAAIIYFMPEKKAADIMASMDPAYAANLTQELMF